jgi:hypothetical protein
LDARVVRAVIQPYRGPQTAAKEYDQDEQSRLMIAVRQLATDARTHQAPLPVGRVLRNDGDALKFDELNRVAPTAAGLLVVLPRAADIDGGREVEVAIVSAAGAVTFSAVAGALINGAATFAPGAAVGLVRFRWDGSGWWV